MMRRLLQLSSLSLLLLPGASWAQTDSSPDQCPADCTPNTCPKGDPPPKDRKQTVTYYQHAEGECNPDGTCDDPMASCRICHDCEIVSQCMVELKGVLWTHPGTKVHPLVIFNHGSRDCADDNPGCDHDPTTTYHALEDYFYQAGYQVFAPSRRGYAPSTGLYFSDYIDRLAAQGNCPDGRHACGAAELMSESTDVILAYGWAMNNIPTADKDRVAIVGHSLGGVVTLATNFFPLPSKNKAFVAIAPGAESWCGDEPLQNMLKLVTAFDNAPTYIFDTMNDVSLGPISTLPSTLGLSRHPFQAGSFSPVHEDGKKVTCGREAHSCFVNDPTYVDRWGPTVLEFLGRFDVN